MIKKLIATALTFAALAGGAHAQAILQPGQVWGNAKSQAAPPSGTNVSALFDIALCNTPNAVPQRVSSWVCTTLGTMATQSASNVAITGGTIKNMPNPTAPGDVVNKAYADGLAAGFHTIAGSRLATAAVLPNTPAYANGAAGVGATLTAGSNTTLTVDGTIANLNDVILVKDQASAFQNGVYTVTAAGSGGAPWVLTRATYFDQAAEMLGGSYTLISAGATNINSSFAKDGATITTVGTDAIVFNPVARAPIIPATRPLLSGDTTFTASSTGNNANDCITLPCRTLQHAYDAATQYDANQHNVSIQITSPCSDCGPLSANNPIIGANNMTVTITGDPVTPANVLVTAANASAMTFTAPMNFVLNGMKITTTGAAFTGNGIAVTKRASVSYQNVDFGSTTLDQKVAAGGDISCIGPFTVSGGALNSEHAYSYGTVNGGCAVTVRNTPAFTGSYSANGGGVMQYSGATFAYVGGGATGRTFGIHFNGVTDTANGTITLPGSTPGDFMGGNYNDNIAGQSLQTAANLFWGPATVSSSAQAVLDGSGNVRQSAGAHNFVTQNPFNFAGGGGSCTPSTIC